MSYIMNALIVMGVITAVMLIGERGVLAGHIPFDCINECRCYMVSATYTVIIKCQNLTARQVRRLRISEEWVRRRIENIVFSDMPQDSCSAITRWTVLNGLKHVASLPENCHAK